MDRMWLEKQLAQGRSIEAIAREAGKDARTVGSWVAKHGLRSAHAERHAPRGGIERAELEALVERGLTHQQLAKHFGVGATTVRHWLRKHGLQSKRAQDVERFVIDQDRVMRQCRTHGWTEFVATGSARKLRCRLCRSAHVSKRRRRMKQILVAEAGGSCVLCGYDRYFGALHFHHLDPADKSFSLSDKGIARSLAAARREAQKCVLLCGNCHAEVECGIATIPP